MQPGDVPATWAGASLLMTLTGYRPQTDVRTGIARSREAHGARALSRIAPDCRLARIDAAPAGG
jgi:hypothetical protein